MSAMGCVFCEDRWPHREPLYEDEHWSLRGLDGPPRFTVLWLRPRAESITELTDDELTSLGPVIARVTAAIEAAAGAERVYVSAYCDGHRHYHVSLIARAPEVPEELRGPALLANLPTLPRDDARAA